MTLYIYMLMISATPMYIYMYMYMYIVSCKLPLYHAVEIKAKENSLSDKVIVLHWK